MIVLDTSVWVAALRGKEPEIGERVRQLLDADEVGLPVAVRVEILSGASVEDSRRLKRVLSALPLSYPSERTWSRIEDWVDRGVAAGERFGVGDLLVAAIAVDGECKLWSLDGDFQRMADLGFVELYRPD